jgi:anti-sigma B factor antagonist
LDVRRETAGTVAVYRIVGRVDALTSPTLESTAGSAIAEGTPRIVYDMREVSYISSAGLRGILLIAKMAKAAKGGLAVFGLQPGVDEVFQTSDFHNIVPIAPDETQALAKLGA